MNDEKRWFSEALESGLNELGTRLAYQPKEDKSLSIVAEATAQAIIYTEMLRLFERNFAGAFISLGGQGMPLSPKGYLIVEALSRKRSRRQIVSDSLPNRPEGRINYKRLGEPWPV